MSYFNIIAQTNENTVITEYEPTVKNQTSYQSEAELEREFIKQLTDQGYEYLNIHKEAYLISNLRTCLEELNNFTFSDNEWNRFFKECISNPNESIAEKTQKIQEDHIQLLHKDNGTSKNIQLIDKNNIHNNKLQVINQYVLGKSEGAKYDNRYDVTILVNGLPLVHIELKRRGVPIKTAFDEIDRYQRDSFWAGSGLYEYIQIFVISNGTNTKYYSNTTRYNAANEHKNPRSGKKTKTSNSFEFTSFWSDSKNRIIPDLEDFTKTFFAKHTILSIITKYCIFTSDKTLLVMRPYQITATERIIYRIEIASNYKKYGTIAGGGYIWHTTGSGKTVTSFKTARIASKIPYIDKVLFVVDRKDLDYQTIKEYDKFEKGAANNNASTAILKRQLENDSSKIIITTIQKLSTFISKNSNHPVFSKHVVIIFDECHRSQFGDMHTAITKSFKKYHIFGFTGTPIFSLNTGTSKNPMLQTTDQTFGDRLHTYTIVNAINDKNVLPFRVDYIKTIDKEEDIEDKQVYDIEREKNYIKPERISLVTNYILEHFNQKTYRNTSYTFNVLQNVNDVVSDKKSKIEEIKRKTYVNGFNSIFAVSSVTAAKLYYDEFQRQMAKDESKRLKVALIYSYNPNEEDPDGILDDENSDDTSALDQNSRDFLEKAISDYNEMFHTNYDTSGDKFQNYYKDVSLRMKNKEIDLLIVVNMFLTGFDATTLNTLWVDKNLKMHGLIQAFSRTNRILNSTKKFGNIVCFRNLQKRTDSAISLFSDENAAGIVLIKTFDDYYYGYTDENNKHYKGFVDMVDELTSKFPLSCERIIGEQNQKDFISLFGAILRMRNILTSFDDFKGKELLSDRELQNYMGIYQDLRDEWRSRIQDGQKEDISDDLVFEIELIRQIEINIDYILLLVAKYHDTNCQDKELLVSIRKAINASSELRSKKDLIESFIEGINDVDDVIAEWRTFVANARERELQNIINEENLKAAETVKFMNDAFINGEMMTTGTDVDKILPPMPRFGGSNRTEKKYNVIAKLQAFFEKFFGI